MTDLSAPLDIEDVRAFVGVVDCGGFRAAAEVLHLAQSAISRRIHRLESVLGVVLLERGGGGMALTAPGTTFLAGARQMLADIDALVVNTRDSEEIRLGASIGALAYLAPFSATWRQRFPLARLRFIPDGTVALRARLRNRSCDFAIISGRIGEDLRTLPFGYVSVVAAIPENHPLADGAETIRIEEFHRQQVMLNEPSFLSHLTFRTACTLEGVEPEIVMESSIAQVLGAHVDVGNAIAICGDRTDFRGYRVRIRRVIDGSGNFLQFPLNICWLAERELSDLFAQFAAELSRFELSFAARTDWQAQSVASAGADRA
jgi:DNA-binding transcriptional LysR family regulator